MNPRKFADVFLLMVFFVVTGCSKEQQNDQVDVKSVPKITCENNLLEIGFAFKAWSSLHNDKYPFQISTNFGGSLELVVLNKDGSDSNAFLYLKNMAGDDGLRTPLLLLCPKDNSKQRVSNWTNLSSGNVTYRFSSDTNAGPFSDQILAVCPVDGNVLYCDGTVVTNGGKHTTDTSKDNSFILELLDHGQKTTN